MSDDITTARIGELTYEMDVARLANRQLLRDLTNLKLKLAMLEKANDRLEAELEKERSKHD